MVRVVQSTEELDELVKSYDDYFTALGSNDVEDITPPATRVEDLNNMLMESVDETATGADYNKLFNEAKVGFTLVKFARTATPAWCIGIKFTGDLYYSEVDDEAMGEEDADD